MKVGVSIRSGYSTDDVRAAAASMVDRARAAASAGLDSLFVGDHHNVPPPFPYYQNVPMLGRLLAEWDDRPAGALFLLPLWHPVLVAEQVGTLAALARGPFVMQCALGGGAGQFAAFGLSTRDRVRHFEAALDVVRRLLDGDEVSTAEPWRIERARIAPTTPEPLEVWVGAAAAPAIDRAARLGDAWLAGPELTPATAREQMAAYADACERHGRTPTCYPIRRDVFVGGTATEIERYAQPVIDGGYRGFDPEAPVVGTVEAVAEVFRSYGALGFTDIITRQLAAADAAAVDSTLRLGEVRRLVTDA